jgi:hypothetical protein
MFGHNQTIATVIAWPNQEKYLQVFDILVWKQVCLKKVCCTFACLFHQNWRG